MNSLKKMFKKIGELMILLLHKKIFYVIVLVFVIIIVSLIFINPNRRIKVSAYTKPYSIVSDIASNDYLKVRLFVSNEKTFFTDVNQITSSYITNGSETLQLKIKDIEVSDEVVSIKGDLMKAVYYNFLIDFSINSDYYVFIDDATLSINYHNGVYASIKIGSFSYYKYNYYDTDDISITSLMPITKTNGISSGFLGFKIGIRNIHNRLITIKAIEVLDGTVGIGDVCKIDDLNKINIEEYFNSQSIIMKDNNLNENLEDVLYFAYALKVNKSYNVPLEAVGIKITYLIDGELKEKYIEKFLFYKADIVIDKDTNIKVYEYAS